MFCYLVVANDWTFADLRRTLLEVRILSASIGLVWLANGSQQRRMGQWLGTYLRSSSETSLNNWGCICKEQETISSTYAKLNDRLVFGMFDCSPTRSQGPRQVGCNVSEEFNVCSVARSCQLQASCPRNPAALSPQSYLDQERVQLVAAWFLPRC
jgi:hypothetical protein